MYCICQYANQRLVPLPSDKELSPVLIHQNLVLVFRYALTCSQVKAMTSSSSLLMTKQKMLQIFLQGQHCHFRLCFYQGKVTVSETYHYESLSFSNNSRKPEVFC